MCTTHLWFLYLITPQTLQFRYLTETEMNEQPFSLSEQALLQLITVSVSYNIDWDYTPV